MTFDVIIRNGLWFDGTGQRPAGPHPGHSRRRRGRGLRRATGRDRLPGRDRRRRASGWSPASSTCTPTTTPRCCWIPGLRESVRHGVTTVLLGNCSLSTVYADTEDAADLFSRVEAVPRKFVLGALEAKKTWSTPAEYVARARRAAARAQCRLHARPFGPADRRCSAWTAPPPTASSRPTPSWRRWPTLLDEALDAGLLGMSGMDAAIDKLDGDRFRSRALPSTFATWRERRRLIKVLRKRGRILQSAPNVQEPDVGAACSS